MDEVSALPAKRRERVRQILSTRVEVMANGCVEWRGPVCPKGYGWFNTRVFGTQLAHRVSYILARGPVPDGLEIDHLCRNRACLNPDHLEAVTQRVNTMRGNSPHAVNARKTHCPKGHALIEGNLVARDLKRGHRACRRCHNDRIIAIQKRKREAAKAVSA